MAFDWDSLPAPRAVERLDYETLRAAWLADFRSRYEDFDALVASDPAIKAMETGAYIELLLRARINSAALDLSMATAEGPNMEVLAANLGTRRLAGEADDALRDRAVASLERPAAGSRAAYRTLAREADDRIVDVWAFSPAPGEVTVSVLSDETPEGIPSAAVLAAVRAALNDEEARPQTDTVTVTGPTIRPYTVAAEITVQAGADPAATLAAARAALSAYCTAQHRLNGYVTRSGLTAALHVSGVVKVALSAPAADVVRDAIVAPWPTADTARDYAAGTHPRGGLTVTLA
ncbi:MAG: baseplate J/gp47 family protein [Rhodospirillales bacterium]|nr:baseplate J/gp47 family protein [Rhodospirillales bacterium]